VILNYMKSPRITAVPTWCLHTFYGVKFCHHFQVSVS